MRDVVVTDEGLNEAFDDNVEVDVKLFGGIQVGDDEKCLLKIVGALKKTRETLF